MDIVLKYQQLDHQQEYVRSFGSWLKQKILLKSMLQTNPRDCC